MKKIAGFLICLLAMMTSTAGTQICSTSDRVQWVALSLKEMQAIKVGMTREDLARVFATEGGMSTGTRRTYAYRDCPYFKIDVDFAPYADGSGGENPKDRITGLSKPYLDWSRGD
jgi:hypothetical protein